MYSRYKKAKDDEVEVNGSECQTASVICQSCKWR